MATLAIVVCLQVLRDEAVGSVAAQEGGAQNLLLLERAEETRLPPCPSTFLCGSHANQFSLAERAVGQGV